MENPHGDSKRTSASSKVAGSDSVGQCPPFVPWTISQLATSKSSAIQYPLPMIGASHSKWLAVRLGRCSVAKRTSFKRCSMLRTSRSPRPCIRRLAKLQRIALLCAYMQMYVYKHTHTPHTHIHTRPHAHTHTYAYTCTYEYIYECMYSRALIDTCMHVPRRPARLRWFARLPKRPQASSAGLSQWSPPAAPHKQTSRLLSSPHRSDTGPASR